VKKDTFLETGRLAEKNFCGKKLLRGTAFPLVASLLFFNLLAILSFPRTVEGEDLPYYLNDRGKGLPTSMFGTYIEKGQLIMYSFYEYNYNTSEEYKPKELGYSGPEADKDFDGKVEEHEALLFLSYGLTDWLSVELEGAYLTRKTLKKDSDDTSNMPDKLEESGLGDVESQIRWRYNRETEVIPEFYSFFEVAFPFQKDKKLIGTQDWEYALGLGIIKGFRWGTLTARGSLLYEDEDNSLQSGEYALEYLKRLSPKWRVYAAIEGEEDEVVGIGEVQYFLMENILFKLNCGFGITDKAPNYAPEVGIMIIY